MELLSYHTRSLTLIEFFRRQGLDDACSSSSSSSSSSCGSELVVHLLGADHREGNSPEETSDIFQMFFEFVQHKMHVQKLVLALIGPNIAAKLDQIKHNQVRSHPTATVKNFEVEIEYFVGCYEEFAATNSSDSLSFTSEEDLSMARAPSVVICFNAGIWGYDSWLPTFEFLLTTTKAPILITSYNMQEAIDDYDELEDNLVCPHEWHWIHEKNPFGSCRPRSTQNEYGATLKENDYWSCIGPPFRDDSGFVVDERKAL